MRIETGPQGLVPRAPSPLAGEGWGEGALAFALTSQIPPSGTAPLTRLAPLGTLSRKGRGVVAVPLPA